MKNWFQGLTLRERTMVKYAAVVLIIFVAYLSIIEPISSSYAKNKKNVEAATKTITWMKEAANEIQQLRGGVSLPNRPQGKQLILSTVDRSARKAGLGSVMKRVQPEGESGVRVWFENAPFDELVKWLAVVESENGLSVNEINIEQTESTGLVNVRVFLN